MLSGVYPYEMALNRLASAMNWKGRMWRCFLFAFLAALLVTAFYDRLVSSRHHFSLGVGLLTPAIDLIQSIDSDWVIRSTGHLEVLAGNVVLYAIWFWVAFCIGDFLLRIAVEKSPYRK